MDFIAAVFEWYEAYSIIVLPLLIAIFVLGVTLGIYQGFKDNLFRTGLLFPLFGVLLGLSFFTGDYGAELYLNLSAQVLMVLTAVILVGTATQLSGWLMPMLIVLVVALGLQFLVPPENFGTNIPATFSPALIGGIMAAYMLRQEWAWSPVEQSKRLSDNKARLQANQ
ncbi:MAG: hypothetical protein AAFN11_03045 [Chloroflexota bacterium]